jgi:uncharacterized membrane protein YuzA (DUF378 family)
MSITTRVLYVVATLAALWLIAGADLPTLPGWPHG